MRHSRFSSHPETTTYPVTRFERKHMKKKMMAATLFYALLLSPGMTAFSQDQKRTPEESFARMDKNADKKLSLEEFVGRKQGDKADKAKANFKKMDKNQDEFLTLEEMKAGRKAK